MIPQELLYAKSHEWLKVDGENAGTSLRQISRMAQS